MADFMKIMTIAGDTLLDLRATTVFLLLDTWRSAPAGDRLVSETFQIGFTGTDATLRTNIESLVSIRQRVIEYFANPDMNRGVTLQAYSDGESAKWALIYDFGAIPVNESAHTPLLGRGHTIYQVSLLRDEAWQYSGTNFATDDISCTGGKMAVNPGSALYGSLNSRIDATYLYDGPATAITRVWIGIQRYLGSSSYSTVNSYFDASWEAEVGTAVAGSFVNDATASPAGTSSNCLEVTTVASSLTKVWWSKLSDHQPTADRRYIYTGNWFVLGRIKVNTGVVSVQLRTGAGSASATQNYEKTNEIVYVSNTSWRLIDLGKVTIPPIGQYNTDSTLMGNSSVALYIQQISGTTTSFKLDEILLIPADHILKLYKCNIDNSAPTVMSESVRVREDYRLQASRYDLSGTLEVTAMNWEWPFDGGFVVVAGERDTAHDLSDTISINLIVVYRFLGHVA